MLWSLPRAFLIDCLVASIYVYLPIIISNKYFSSIWEEAELLVRPKIVGLGDSHFSPLNFYV